MCHVIVIITLLTEHSVFFRVSIKHSIKQVSFAETKRTTMADPSTVATDSSGRQRIHRLGYYNTSKPFD